MLGLADVLSVCRIEKINASKMIIKYLVGG